MQGNSTRAVYLDLFKTMLVLGMILAHVIQLVGIRVRPLPLAGGISDFINLITFSGFMLAFGIGVGLSRGGEKTLAQRLRPAAMLLAAAYMSSLAFVMLVDRRVPGPELLLDLLSLRVLYGWSEFLASFFMLYLLLAFFRPTFVAIARNGWLLALACALCLLATNITTSTNIPLSATIVANTNYANFPLLPYLPWFLLGIRLGLEDGRLRWWHVAGGVGLTGAFCWWTMANGAYPQRFPPSALWVVGPAAFLLAYLAIARAIARQVAIPPALLLPGRHVLMFLLVSNLIIFTARYWRGQPIHQVWEALAAAALIVAAISVYAVGYERIWSKKAPRPTAAPQPQSS